jgi:hypothetical protein
LRHRAIQSQSPNPAANTPTVASDEQAATNKSYNKKTNKILILNLFIACCFAVRFALGKKVALRKASSIF